MLRAEFAARLVGLLLGGSVARATATTASDLDVFALVDVEWHQRRRLSVVGIDVDLFLDPPRRARRVVSREKGAVLLENYATGWIAYDPLGEVERICSQARSRYERGRTPATPVELFAARTRCTDVLETVVRAAARGDRDGLDYASALLVAFAVESYYRVEGRWDPPPKRRMAQLAADDPPFAGVLREVLDTAAPPPRRAQAALAIVERLFGAAQAGREATWSARHEVRGASS